MQIIQLLNIVKSSFSHNRLPKPCTPAGVVRKAGFDEELYFKNPRHWIVRIAWILFFPEYTKDYFSSRGSKSLEAMDWWLGSTGIFFLAWLTTWKYIKVADVGALEWLGISLAIYLILWLLTGWMGSSTNGMGHFLASILLALVAGITIFATLLSMNYLAIALINISHRIGNSGSLPLNLVFSSNTFVENYYVNVTKISVFGLLAAYTMQIPSIKSVKFFCFSVTLLGFGVALWRITPPWGDNIAQALAVVFGLMLILLAALNSRLLLRWALFILAIAIICILRNPTFWDSLAGFIDPIERWLESQ